MSILAEKSSEQLNVPPQHIDQRRLEDVMVEEMLEGCLPKAEIIKLGQLLMQPTATLKCA